MTRVFSVLAATIAVAVPVAVALAAGGTAAAATMTSVPSPPGGQLNAVDCAAVGHCFAVGTSRQDGALIERLSGTHWSQVDTPLGAKGGFGTLASLACGAHWCVAVGNDNCGAPLAEFWTGGAWSDRTAGLPSSCNHNGTHLLLQIGCASPRFCLAAAQNVHSETTMWRWNGRRWSALPFPSAHFSLGLYVNDLACPAANACFTTGEGGAFGVWNGHMWTFTVRPSLIQARLSCPTASFCMLTSGFPSGLAPAAVTWRAGTLGAPVTLHMHRGKSADVSCASARRCLAIGARGGHGSSAVYSGGRWRAAEAMPGTGNDHWNAVSCPTASWCMAVGDQTPPSNETSAAIAAVLPGR